jgi:hypothetical protein
MALLHIGNFLLVIVDADHFMTDFGQAGASH